MPRKEKSRPIAQTSVTSTPQLPDWPAFKPSLPIANLTLEPPASAFEDKLLVLRNFFPKSLCRDYVTFFQGLPLATTPGRPKRGEAVRVNDRFQVDDFRFAQRLWLETGLREALLDDSVKHLWYVSPTA